MTQREEFNSLISRFASTNSTRKLIEGYAECGLFDLQTCIDYIKPIVIEMDKDLASLGA